MTAEDPLKIEIPIAGKYRGAVVGAVLILLFVALASLRVTAARPAITIGFVVVIAISTWKLGTAVTRQPVSVDLIHWFFVLLFFGVAPLVVYLTGSFRFDVTPRQIGMVNIIVFTWIVGYWAAYLFTSQKNTREPEAAAETTAPAWLAMRPHPLAVVLIIIGTTTAAFLLIWLLGIESFTTRAVFRDAMRETVGLNVVGLAILRVVRPAALLAPLIGVLYAWDTDARFSIWVASSIGLLVGVVVNNPAASARLWAFAVLFGFIIIMSWRWTGNGLLYLSVLFAGIFASQLFHVFRFARSLSGADLELQPLAAYLTAGHFDAYENIAHTVAYVAANGHTNGRQLAGGLLFWVPRSFWPEKPIASGQVVYGWLAETHAVGNLTVAIPLPGEAYLDFGLIGVAALAVIYGSGIALLDSRLRWTPDMQSRLPDGWIDPGYVIYPLGIGVFLVHFRGTFLSTFSILAMYAGTAIALVVCIRALSRAFESVDGL